MVRKILPFMMIMLLASCVRQEASDELLSYFRGAPTVSVKPEESIALDHYGILVPTWITRYQDSFIIKKQKADNFVDILTPEGNVIPCVKMGRGPGEILLAGSVQVQGDALYVYGLTEKKLLVLDLPGTIAAREQVLLEERQMGSGKQTVSDEMVMPVNLQLYKDRIYAVGLYGDGSLCAELSQDGALISGIPGAEIEDSRVDDMARRVLNSGALLSISPDGSRIAAAYSMMAAMSFADTRPELTMRWSKTFFQPSLRFPNIEGAVVGFGKDNVTAFQGLQAFNDKVLALYSGKNRENVEDDDPDHCRHLFVLDWDGKPLKSYELQEQIVSFYLDGEDLYGLSYYPEPKIFRFELK